MWLMNLAISSHSKEKMVVALCISGNAICSYYLNCLRLRFVKSAQKIILYTHVLLLSTIAYMVHYHTLIHGSGFNIFDFKEDELL